MGRELLLARALFCPVCAPISVVHALQRGVRKLPFDQRTYRRYGHIPRLVRASAQRTEWTCIPCPTHGQSVSSDFAIWLRPCPSFHGIGGCQEGSKRRRVEICLLANGSRHIWQGDDEANETYRKQLCRCCGGCLPIPTIPSLLTMFWAIHAIQDDYRGRPRKISESCIAAEQPYELWANSSELRKYT